MRAPPFRRRRLCQGGFALLVSLLLIGCLSSGPAAEGAPGLRRSQGEASYYGSKFAGRPTASGEIFNPQQLTAAHRTLPFDTVVRVTRIDDPHQSVDVRINDRGPFKRGRIIDLSRAAAQEIDMISEGVAEVRLEVVSYPDGVDKPSASSTPEGW